MKRLGQFLAKVVLFVLLLGGSFVAGMVFYASYYGSGGAGSPLTALSLAGVSAAGPDSETLPPEAPVELITFWEAWSFLDEEFYGEFPAETDRIYGATRGMVASFGDQHTTFIDPTRAAIMSENISGSFEGVGATIRLEEGGRLVIADTYPGRPAFDAGVRPGDVIVAVDSQSTEGLNLFEAVLLIRGPAGTDVVLTVFREGQPGPLDITVTRAKIELEIVESRMLEGPDNIGYVRLTQFSKGASERIADAIEALTEQGAEHIIFDLRSNPGGLLSEAIAVSSVFIEEGPIVIEKLREGEEKIFEVKEERQIALDVPLVVLVNGGSASASEIVAGAIQDHERGIVIGETTFGKGTVQLPHRLSDGSELRVTVAEWLTPANRKIRGEGITPDVIIEMTIEDLETGLDPQLAEAIMALSSP